MLLWRRRLLFLERGVEPLEFDARISGREAPIDRDGVLIAPALPGLDLLIQSFACPNAAGEALAGQGREFNLGHIQPTPMHWRILEFQLLQETMSFGWCKGRI